MHGSRAVTNFTVQQPWPTGNPPPRYPLRLPTHVSKGSLPTPPPQHEPTTTTRTYGLTTITPTTTQCATSASNGHTDVKNMTHTTTPNSSLSTTAQQPKKRPRLSNKPLQQKHNQLAQPQTLPIVNMPFVGDYRGCFWNAQALFANDPGRQHAKRSYWMDTWLHHDFGGVVETHGVDGIEDAIRLPRDCTAYWSHCSSQEAGIGLMLKDKFLARVNPVSSERDWKHIIPGRVGMLSLRGAEGALDLIVAYFATGQQGAKDRMIAMQKLAQQIKPREEALTIMVGDWNFAKDERGRFSKATCEWSGGQDKQCAANWLKYVQTPHQLHELNQSAFTCDVAGARSRIDRVYVNNFASEQLDRRFTCVVLPWTGLSAHRPLSFGRSSASRDKHSRTTLPIGPIDHPDWARRVALGYHTAVSRDLYMDSPLRRLVLVKRAIKSVTRSMHK